VEHGAIDRKVETEPPVNSEEKKYIAKDEKGGRLLESIYLLAPLPVGMNREK
jgi:hypothetical protein